MYIVITVIRVCYILLAPNSLFRVVKLCGSMLMRCMPCLWGYVLEANLQQHGSALLFVLFYYYLLHIKEVMGSR